MVSDLPSTQAACNHILQEVFKCYEEHPIRRFTGYCSPIVRKLDRCILKQFDLRQERNAKLSAQRQGYLKTTPKTDE